MHAFEPVLTSLEAQESTPPYMNTLESPEKNTGKEKTAPLSLAEQQKQLEFQQEAIAHINSLYNYALHLTMNQDDAEDLVQETYLKAYKFFNSFERGTNCKAWLFKILKNNYINRFRKNSREPGKVDYDLIKDFYHSIKDTRRDTTETDSDYFHSLLHEEVYQALQSLPEEFREVIQLCDIEGFTYEEIANMVESPIGTVRSRLYRGRKLLRGQLEAYAKKYGFNTDNAE
jgi:RNA polymerase sigma-70 factor, ECF subfamily